MDFQEVKSVVKRLLLVAGALSLFLFIGLGLFSGAGWLVENPPQENLLPSLIKTAVFGLAVGVAIIALAKTAVFVVQWVTPTRAVKVITVVTVAAAVVAVIKNL